MIYTNENDAIHRIEQLQRVGIWPGYYRCGNGYRLTFDPIDSTALDSHGYLQGPR